MQRHSYIAIAKLSNLKGRIDYVTNPDRQENLYETYNTTDDLFWKQLAKENQSDFKQSGTKGKCIEARVYIVALPENFLDYNKEQLWIHLKKNMELSAMLGFTIIKAKAIFIFI